MSPYKELLDWSQLAANVVTALGILGFALFWFTHRENLKQFRFNVMLNCIERYLNLIPLEENGKIDSINLRKYIDLTSEEFFYFQQTYIPHEVMIEWLDSIVQNFPIYYSDGVIQSSSQPILSQAISDSKLLMQYPRIMKALTIDRKYLEFDLSTTSGKTELIKTVASNLGLRLKDKHFRKAVLS